MFWYPESIARTVLTLEDIFLCEQICMKRMEPFLDVLRLRALSLDMY
jgi:hypothetical protein